MEYINYYGQTLYHHGVKGQKWGLRKYQNEDGSLTAAGREHYGYGQARANMQSAKAKYKADQKAYSKAFNRATGAGQYIRGLTKKGKAENERRYAELVKTANKASKSEAAYKQAKQEYKNSDEYKARQEKIKKAAVAGAAVAATALAVYGAYKLNEFKKNKEADRYREIGKAYQKVHWSIWDGWADEFHGKRNADGSRDYSSGRVHELDKALKNAKTEDERRLLNAKINRAKFDEKNRRRAMDRAVDRAIYYNNKAYK